MNVNRLEQLGLKAGPNLNSGKNLDQMQPHIDYPNEFVRDSIAPGQAKLDFKRISQHRAQQLPLGGLLGERIAKSMSLYNSQQPQTEHVSPKASKEQLYMRLPKHKQAER